MSILLGMANLCEAIVDAIEYGPIEAVKINTSFCPEAERSYRKIMKDLETEPAKTDVALSKTDENRAINKDVTVILDRNLMEYEEPKSSEDIVDETEEEAIRKAVEEKTCW